MRRVLKKKKTENASVLISFRFVSISLVFLNKYLLSDKDLKVLNCYKTVGVISCLLAVFFHHFRILLS